jgi:hypothetical protein
MASSAGDVSTGTATGCEGVHARGGWIRRRLAETIMEMNRSLAKALLAITYPLRFTAHLTDSQARESRAGARGHRDSD